ncbi:Arc family DNA-binding protein [Gluconacetobacter azotocaptans]|nr:Arc family DNA-binding protein [Gluconacetobacter azotocaptans]
MKIRLPEAVKVWLAQEATRNRRSQNSELITCLEAIMRQRTQKDEASGSAGKQSPDASE